MLINLRPSEVQYLAELLEDDDTPFSSDRATNSNIIRALRFAIDAEIPPHHRKPQRLEKRSESIRASHATT